MRRRSVCMVDDFDLHRPCMAHGRQAYDADKRVIEPLLAAGKTPVIPSVPGRSLKRPYDRDMHLKN